MAEIIEFNKKNNSNETNNRLEKILLLYNQTTDEKYLKTLDMLYNLKRLEYEIIIQKEVAQEWKQNWGMGFWFALNEFNAKPLIKDFMAKHMLEEIYREDKEGGAFYPLNNQKSYASIGLFVNAWMSLPEPYRKE